eukprot:TRINITY_DN3457_c0_g1_i3.p1 TRINITY_DN3457_c0_g1~~TRINITY_DN3457_c0_g1_i3.p1  ORF type:complete len:123 (+),score=31.00 TRINITY_DN3457_c0_g1_i3:39-407(+)
MGLGYVALVGAIAAIGAAATLHAAPASITLNLLGTIGMFVTAAMGAHTLIPVTTALFTDAGINGIDLNKRTTERDPAGNLVRPIKGVKVPESMGLVCCTVYLIVIFLFIPISAAGDLSLIHI